MPHSAWTWIRLPCWRANCGCDCDYYCLLPKNWGSAAVYHSRRTRRRYRRWTRPPRWWRCPNCTLICSGSYYYDRCNSCRARDRALDPSGRRIFVGRIPHDSFDPRVFLPIQPSPAGNHPSKQPNCFRYAPVSSRTFSHSLPTPSRTVWPRFGSAFGRTRVPILNLSFLQSTNSELPRCSAQTLDRDGHDHHRSANRGRSAARVRARPIVPDPSVFSSSVIFVWSKPNRFVSLILLHR
mmetsp:Transcript_33938/g.39330  ORF Transcript_33938/g.39330 Transcript_33938/m.39330 type:complete len:238 (+) Transcript_33938:772-1485(+)